MKQNALFIWPGQEKLGRELALSLHWEIGDWEWRRFPDGETYLRILSPVTDREVWLLASLDHPDDKLAPLLWFAATARELGAARVKWVAPYLGYLRQDKRFKEGEALSSRYFARLISQHFEGLVTVDPHLHRYKDLSEIYSIPTKVLSSSGPIAAWVKQNVPSPCLLGPDGESAQWVGQVAGKIGAPFVVAAKERLADRDVIVKLPEITRFHDHTPVLLDDIISTGRTTLEAVQALRAAGVAAPLCIAVHGIFAENAYEEILAAGAAGIVTSNSIPHPSNRIDLGEILAAALRDESTTKR